jgi:3-oxoacyl-[acyl-carrier protein] reductase
MTVTGRFTGQTALVTGGARGIGAATAARPGMSFDEFQGLVGSQTALQRVGQPDDVASVIAFLCSSDAASLSGQVIDVRGGP